MCTNNMLSSTLMLLFLTLALQNNVHAQLSSGSQCTSPDGQVGSCTSIRECPLLWELLTKRRPFAGMTATTYLQRSQCGFEGRLPIVCCPGLNPSVQPVSPTQKPVVKPPVRPVTVPNPGIIKTEIPTQSNPNQLQGNPLSHRNIGLLPQNCGNAALDQKIVGGSTTELDEHPWLAGLVYQTRKGEVVACGGVLISPRYVLTAAHCIGRVPNAQLIGVRLGEHDLRSDPDCEDTSTGKICNDPVVRVPIEKLISHSNYRSSNPDKHNDIGLIRLRSAVNITDFVKPICLPKDGVALRSNFAGTQQVVSGWGRTETSSNSDIKMKVSLPVLENARCSQLYNGRVKLDSTQMCAGGQSGKDSCNGDSGGPLMLPRDDKWYVTGVVSVGPQKCGTENQPGIYTRVGPFMTWILDNMRNESTCYSPPRGEEGICVNIRSCPEIVAMLRESPRKTETIQRVQAAQCGVEGTTPMVCCPLTLEVKIGKDEITDITTTEEILTTTQEMTVASDNEATR